MKKQKTRRGLEEDKHEVTRKKNQRTRNKHGAPPGPTGQRLLKLNPLTGLWRLPGRCAGGADYPPRTSRPLHGRCLWSFRRGALFRRSKTPSRNYLSQFSNPRRTTESAPGARGGRGVV